MALAEELATVLPSDNASDVHQNIPSPSTEDKTASSEASPEAKIDSALYQAELIVKDSSDAERTKAFPALFEKVLIKISGNSKIANLSSIRLGLKQAEQYVEQFSYAHLPETEASTDLPTEESSEKITLRASFNQDKTNDLLKQAKQPIFNKIRPQVVVWFIVQEKDHKNEIVSNLSEEPLLFQLSESIQEAANTVGLPIVLPFGDLEDMSLLSADNLSTLSPKKIIHASKRYAPGAILVIKMNADKHNSCASDWSLLNKISNTTKTPHWQESLASCKASLQDGMIQTLHDLMLQNQATHSLNDDLIGLDVKNVQEFHVSIANIQSVQDYQQVLNYLQKQPHIVDVQIEKASPSHVVYTVHFKGNLAGFEKNMQNDTRFQFLKKDIPSNTLAYEFVGESSSDIWRGE